MSLSENRSHADYCKLMLSEMSLLCKEITSSPWADDWEYLCWAYLIGDLPLEASKQKDILMHLNAIKQFAEKVNGWVNDVTYFEMERWQILYQNWKRTYPPQLDRQ